MTTKIQKWGNSSAVRIPKSFMQASGLVQGGEISFEFKDGLIVMNPEKQKKYVKPKYTLEGLLKNFDKKTQHELIDWGPDVGNEILPPWQE